MSKKEQQVNDVQMLKKAWIGNAIMLFLIVVAVILAVFAWVTFNNMNIRAQGIRVRTLSDRNISFSTQAGTVNNDGSISFSGNNYNSELFNPSVQSVAPGEKRYFKTTIENNETSAYYGTFMLQGLLVNRDIVDMTKVSTVIQETGGGLSVHSYSTALSFGVEAKTNEDLNEALDHSVYPRVKDNAFYLENEQDYLVNGAVSSQYYYYEAQSICSDIRIPPRSGGLPGKYEIIWFFKVDGDSLVNLGENDANDIMGKSLFQFGQMIFNTESVVNE